MKGFKMWIDKKNVLVALIGILIVVAIGAVCNILTLKQKGSFASIEMVKEKNLPTLKIEKTIEITVREGFCLSEIAHDLGTNWKEIAELNNIANPDLILPGQKITVRPFDKIDIVKASWYGPGFNGKLMANGRIFNMNDPNVVAHKWLPFGTIVRLTRIDNRKSIVVIVQDRGPYIQGRIFDLSRGAAELLGMVDEGVTTCKIELLD